MRAFLVERMGYDAIFAHCVVIVLIGVALEVAGLIAVSMILNGVKPFSFYLPGKILALLAAVGAFQLGTASLGYGLGQLALARLAPIPARVLSLLLSPLATALAVLGAFGVMKLANAYAPPLGEVALAALIGAYTTLGLPLVAAAIWAGRKIAGERIRAEHVFGGPP